MTFIPLLTLASASFHLINCLGNRNVVIFLVDDGGMELNPYMYQTPNAAIINSSNINLIAANGIYFVTFPIGIELIN